MLSDRVGNATLATTWTRDNRVTMGDLYPENKKTQTGGQVLFFPGQPPVVLG